MKYIPQLEEERFQSMVAVPILARAGDTIGVIVLHTKAPHEFTEDTLKLLVHIASLVSGAIENAQLYDQQRRRVDSADAPVGTGAGGGGGDATQPSWDRSWWRGTRRLLGAAVCQLYRLDSASAALALLASRPGDGAPGPAMSATGLLLAALDGGGAAAPGAHAVARARRGRPAGRAADRRRRARRAAVRRSRRRRRPFTDEDTEIARAIAHLTAIAIKRAELIEGLTNANIVKDLFEALAAGATTFAAAKAAEVRCDLSGPYLMVYAEPAAAAGAGSGEWRAAAEVLGRELAALAPDDAVDAGPGPVRAVLALGSRRAQPVEELMRSLPRARRARQRRDRHQRAPRGPGETPRAPTARRVDAATIGRALLGDGGAIAYSQVGAYRYLVHIAAEDAPHDRMRAAPSTG